MKNRLLLGAFLMISAPAHATALKNHTFVPIEIGATEHVVIDSGRKFTRYEIERHKYANRKLRKRVRQLEKAMVEIQNEVLLLRSRVSAEPLPTKYACYIKTSFNGTHMGRGVSLAEAKARTLQRCEKAGGNFDCKVKKVTCS